MKYFLAVLVLSSYSFCNAQEIIYSDTEPDQDELLIVSDFIDHNKNLITFTSNFKDDLLSIIVHNNSIYNGRISTDELLGSAGGILFDRYSDSITVSLNDEIFQLKNNPTYRFLYVYRNENKYVIEYRKTPLLFE